jgi:hypothetical protein
MRYTVLVVAFAASVFASPTGLETRQSGNQQTVRHPTSGISSQLRNAYILLSGWWQRPICPCSQSSSYVLTVTLLISAQAYITDDSLPTHTIYMPKTVPAGVKLPVLVWGEGGCAANGLAFLSMLTDWASHGFFIMASGAPKGTGRTTAKYMSDAITWIGSKAGSEKYAAVDPTRIAAAGMSCGGIEAYEMNSNDKVSFIGIFNSGLLQNTTNIANIKKPVFFFLGGPSDIAYENVSRC